MPQSEPDTKDLRRSHKEYTYPRYQFTNESSDIKELFCAACDRLGIKWRRMNRKTISVARREDVEKMDAIVGPKY